MKGGFSDDPEAWLATIDERAFANWVAFYDLEPWGNEYLRDASISQLLSAQFAATSAQYGGEYKVQELDDFMPPTWKNAAKKKKSGKISLKGLDEAKTAMQKRFG